MTESTPKLITPEQYTSQVQVWTVNVRHRMARNAPVASGTLRRSLESFVDQKNGVAFKIRYNFERHGVFIHYGVGRGYIRVGNTVMPGRRLTKAEQGQYRKRGDNKKDIAKLRVVYNDGSVRRTPFDWFDMEIKIGLSQLAEIAQDYKGDVAMRRILEQIDKATIQKKI